MIPSWEWLETSMLERINGLSAGLSQPCVVREEREGKYYLKIRFTSDGEMYWLKEEADMPNNSIVVLTHGGLTHPPNT